MICPTPSILAFGNVVIEPLHLIICCHNDGQPNRDVGHEHDMSGIQVFRFVLKLSAEERFDFGVTQLLNVSAVLLLFTLLI